jgi:photosystem II stability/assembly factor-like uncharacterized protein
MKRNLLILLVASILTTSYFIIPIKTTEPSTKKTNTEKGEEPNDYFFRQRAFPSGKVSYEAYHNAILQAANLKETANKRTKSEKSLNWQFAGPNNLGGRVSCVAMPKSSSTTIYVGAASGGVFKSIDAGATWTPIFDAQPSLSIGDIAVAPSDSNTIYVGTGESNCGGGGMTYDGMGVYKSTDGGATWASVGLDSTRNTGRIAINPVNPNIVFVATMGDLFGTTPQRGIYRTMDGGTTWQQVLYVSDSTGGTDLAINPQNPDTIFAAMWERVRTPSNEDYGGNQCNIYRSVDSGSTWTILTSGLPANSASTGRIGIGISPSSPATIYASICNNTGGYQGFYQSTNNGNSWTLKNSGINVSSYGWWNGRVTVDPTNANTVYCVAFDLNKSTNGGSSFSTLPTNHVDQHACYINPNNNNFVLEGNDGGLDISTNGGGSFTNANTLPIMQFYSVDIDYQHPTNLYGGAQDNGTNRTLTGNINDWANVYGGDGFYCAIDPLNDANKSYESQYGAASFGTFGSRENWCTPFVLDPIVPTTIYYGAEKLYKNGTAISADLTYGAGTGNLVYGTITTISVSKVNNQVIYVGCDDGRVQVTRNGGGTWTDITAGLPVRWVTRVTADPIYDSVGYVTISGYKYDEYLPHVFRTTNYGAAWTDISGNLPEAPVSELVVDPNNNNILYAGTDVGVYVTSNLGNTWQLLAPGMPNVPVTMMKLYNPTRILVAATYGRSMYKLDISTVTGSPSINDVTNVSVNVYPNPFTSQVIFSFDNQINNASIKIFDVQGKEVMSKENVSGRQVIVERGNLNAGLYFYSITKDNQNIATGKLIVE